MSYTSPAYRPSVLELARAGNFQAIAYWINSLLGPQGVHVQAASSRTGSLTLYVDFQYPTPKEYCLGLRRQLVRFICYRLWTLNSTAIQDVRIVARMVGNPDVLWRQSVRIVTPANRVRVRRSTPTWRSLAQRGAGWLWFQSLRSIVVGRFAVAGFFLCYWLVYWEMMGFPAMEQTIELVAPANANDDTHQAPTKRTTRVTTPVSVSIEGSFSMLPVMTVPEQFQGQIVRQATPANGEKLVALTFDDGPWKGTTEQVLEILKQYNIKATFFLVGQQVQAHPEVAKKVVAAGHALGNHSWTHPIRNIDTLTAAQEIGNTTRIIYETTGVKTTLVRPPGGNLEGQMIPYAKQQNNTIVLWSADSSDYYVSTPLIIDNVLSNTRPGGIILLHDGGGDRAQTIQALPQIITTLLHQGYKFVTVPELLAKQAKEAIATTPADDASAPTN
jgi:peptidoglycan/xylan/chitin deacetylase (PgdA/CDA1 family)